ncbi:peptidylprolyl isomerase [Ectothiorhodospiraceae bacterium WFHF3C12]|nr:peptidylprolyl isomerase [Ectothiorhodospiraceae bacterium WFHF3C12]
MTITVNGVEISDASVNVESAFHEEGDILQRQFDAARALVIREVLRQRAAEHGLLSEAEPAGEGDAALDEAIDALLEREVETPEPDESACRQYFDSNRAQFRTPSVLEVRHILLAAPPEDLEAREEARNTAEELIAVLQSQPERFDELARAHSRCPSAKEGGQLGQVSRGQTVPEFEEALERLEPGLAARPLNTRYGYHVVQVDHHMPGRDLGFEEVRDTIADYLRERSHRRAVSQYLKLLLAEADIQGIELEEADSPLLQ